MKKIIYLLLASVMVLSTFLWTSCSKDDKNQENNDHYVMVGVVTHGNFYIVSDSELTFGDLAGKQIAVPMKGAVPDWTFQMVAKQYGLNCVEVTDTTMVSGKINIKYYAEASNIVPLMLSGAEKVGLVPEPAVSGLMKKAQNQGKTLYKMDLQELYDSETKAYPQAVLMVKRSVVGAHQGLVDQLKSKIDGGVSWAKENPALAVESIGEHGATTLQAAALSQSAIDGCKIYFQESANAKQSVIDYVNKIIQIDSAKAKAVNDDFFYNGETSQNDKESYTFIAPDGAPALAISKMMSDGDKLSTGKDIDYQIVAATQIRNALVSGSADFILAPVNMASQFYKECVK